MTRSEPAAAPESLLAQKDWMRRLARSLVRDDGQADDLVQDAMAAALRSPPRDPLALPAWLATSIKNGARQLWRGEGRRAVREEAASRPEPQPSAAEVVARAEEHGLVVRAVLALEEPYRTTLLLRFYDDLPPREVAKRTGVPVETARARIRRGIEHLRTKLDAAHGGDGSAWRLALAPLLFHKTATTVGAGAGAAASSHSLTTGAMVMAGKGTTVLVGVLALIAGAVVGIEYGISGHAEALQKSQDALDEKLKEVAALESEAAARDERAKRQAMESESKLRAAQTETAELKTALDVAKVSLQQARAAAASKGEATAKAPVKRGPRFAFDQYGKLDDVDWASVGEHLAALAPLVDEIAKAIEKGESPSPEARGKAAQHNGVMITAVLKVVGQVPGTGANASFVHPAFMVNSIAATLEAAGKPLTAEQAVALERLGREMTDEDVKRLQDYPATTFTLKKTMDETALRRRFIDGAFGLLEPDQREALTPASAKGYLGVDFFSEGLAWLQFLAPVPFKDQAALVDSVTHTVQTGLHTTPDQAAALRSVVAKWAGDLPQDLVDPAAPNRPKPGMVKVETVQAEAALTLKLLQSVVADLKLEGAQAESARKWQGVLLLMPSAE